jgi:hypothetical protein
MFFSSVSLGTTSLPLVDLLTKCECGGSLPLVKAAEDRSTSGRKGATLSAGSLKVLLRLRKPLAEAEVRRTEERVLVLEQWPAVTPGAAMTTAAEYPQSSPAAPASASTAAISSSAAAVAVAAKPVAGTQANHPAAAAVSTAAAAATAKTTPPTKPNGDTRESSILQEREKLDPTSVEFLESNDVLEAELALADGALARARGGPAGDDADDQIYSLNLRSQLIATKLRLLVESVQSEQLSLDDYLQRIRARVGRDEVLLRYLVGAGAHTADPDDQATLAEQADAVRRRIDIMKSEILSAEDA